MGNGLRPAGSKEKKENDTVANPRMNLKKKKICKAMVTGIFDKKHLSKKIQYCARRDLYICKFLYIHLCSLCPLPSFFLVKIQSSFI
jgi:hypothetical protein